MRYCRAAGAVISPRLNLSTPSAQEDCHEMLTALSFLEPVYGVTVSPTPPARPPLSTHFNALNQRLQAAIAPTLLEPDLLTGTNVISLFPPVVLQGLELITVGAEPQRNALPLAVRFRKRDRHIGPSILSHRCK